MNQGDFSKQFIIRSALIILLVTPIVGFLIATTTTKVEQTLTLHPAERSSSELLKTINDQQNEFSNVVSFKETTVDSVKRYKDMWYLVSVRGTYISGDTGKERTGVTPAIVGDFRNDKNSMTLVLPPGGSLPHRDISDSMGIPYELLDELNKTEEKL